MGSHSKQKVMVEYNPAKQPRKLRKHVVSFSCQIAVLCYQLYLSNAKYTASDGEAIINYATAAEPISAQMKRPIRLISSCRENEISCRLMDSPILMSHINTLVSRILLFATNDYN